MIIVDENAEKMLVQWLRHYLRNPTDIESIYCKLDPLEAGSGENHQKICALLQREIPTESSIYFCDHGEIVILAPNTTRRIIHNFALKLAEMLHVTPAQCGFEFHDLRDHAPQCLHHFEKKIEQFASLVHAHQDQSHRHVVEVQEANKRREILDVSSYHDCESRISRIRTSRGTSEVMVIEDDAFSRRLVENSLSKEHHITGLPDAEKALITYIKIAPNILFLDINLPHVNGHDLLEKILLVDPQAYVVMLSGNADRDNINEAMKRGAKGFVAKPFTPEKLHQYIQRCPTIH